MASLLLLLLFLLLLRRLLLVLQMLLMLLLLQLRLSVPMPLVFTADDGVALVNGLIETPCVLFLLLISGCCRRQLDTSTHNRSDSNPDTVYQAHGHDCKCVKG